MRDKAAIIVLCVMFIDTARGLRAMNCSQIFEKNTDTYEEQKNNNILYPSHLDIGLYKDLSPILSRMLPTIVKREISGETNIPLLDRKHKEELNNFLMKFISGTRIQPELISAIKEKQQVEGISIVTHPVQTLQRKIPLAFEGTSPFINFPMILLTSIQFPITEEKLIAQTTFVQYSAGGEFDIRLNTGEIHLFGGFCINSLATTAESALKGAFSFPERKKVSLTIHVPLIYTVEGLEDSFAGAETTKLPTWNFMNFVESFFQNDRLADFRRVFNTIVYNASKNGLHFKFADITREREVDIFVIKP